MMRRRRWGIGLAIALAAAALTAAFWPGRAGHLWDPPPRDPAPAGVPLAPGEVRLVVMTYNVEGLPWPIKSARSDALDAIGDRLAALRAQGRAPHVVLLQEAFIDRVREIGRRGGYRHAVEGPASTTGSPDIRISALPDHYVSRGEQLPAFLSGGLTILSDYPVEVVAREAFPRNVCAGYDCLANKGVMLVRIRVPGLPDPVEVVNSHVTSRHATGTPLAHSNAAYSREIAAIGRVLEHKSDARLPRIIGGDFNVDHDAGRLKQLARASANWVARTLPGAESRLMLICGVESDPCSTASGMALDLRHRTNDWQFYSQGERVALIANAHFIRFAPDANRRTLSDHQALVVEYRLRQR